MRVTAEHVYDYISGLPQRTDHKLISAQEADFPTDAPTTASAVADLTGTWIGLAGSDYYAYGWDPRDVNSYLLGYWRQGGLVELSVHMNNPVTGGLFSDRTAIDPAKMITPGTRQNDQLHQELDRIAAQLQVLKEAGVVVLFRPFHEMNGGWFWWGDWKASQFQALWRDTFDYLTRTKGLDNLLWVYSPNEGSGNYTSYYPGPKYVDIVGLDIYSDLEPGCRAPSDWAEMNSLGKPSAITDFGAFGPTESDSKQNYDWTHFLECIKSSYPQATYFLAWSNGWALSNPGKSKANAMLADPYVANLSAVQSDLVR